MKKAFIVTVSKEIEIVVIAETEHDAIQEAEEESDYILEDADLSVYSRPFVKERHTSWLREWPRMDGQEAGCTLGEMIEAGEVTP